MFSKFFIVFMICFLMSLVQSCTQINVKKITYQALRKHDCRVNEPNAFCARSYAVDYHEYERIRQKLLSNNQTSQYQVKLPGQQSDSGNSKQ